MRIRAAREDDAKGIVRLVGGLAGELNDEVRLGSGYVKRYLRSPHCHAIIALDKQEPIGLLAYSIRPGLYHAGPSLYIEDLYVERKFRKMGVASALIRRVLHVAKRMKCIEVSVSTGFWNRKAIGLYRKHGLKERSLLLEAHIAKGG